MEDQIPLPPAPSLGNTIIDVFTSPSDTFKGLHKTASKPSLWAIPLIVTLLMVILTMLVSFTNESLKSQRIDATRSVLEQRVAENKMTQEQMDKAIEGMESGSTIMIVIPIVIVSIIITFFFFLSALLLWLGSKIVLKSTAGYEKILELNGITSWIGILGIILQILMMVGLNSIYAVPSLSIFFYTTFDPLNSIHKILAMMNFFAIWQTIIIAIGLQKWSDKGITTPLIISFVVWLITVGLMYLLGFGG
jgi:hypothetical protein